MIAKLVADATKKGLKSKLFIWIMPCNVVTCWNLIYEMLKFAYSYQEAIKVLTGNQTLKLQDYKWDIVKQLCDCLKVSISFIILYCSTFWNSFSDLQNGDVGILNRYSLPSRHYSCDGQDAWWAHSSCQQHWIFTSTTGGSVNGPWQVLFSEQRVRGLSYHYEYASVIHF